jgi:glycosyltransferase involved in cell wall biosynthesis
MIIHCPEVIRNNVKRKIFRRMVGLGMLNGAAWVQANTERERGLLKSYGVTTPIRIILNGITAPTGIVDNRVKDLISNLARPRVGFLGRLDWRTKGLDLLLEGYAHFARKVGDDAGCLILAGPDWNNSIRTLNKMALDLKIEQRTKFIGEISFEAAQQFLRDLDVLVLPSRFESFGRVVPEAGLAGCPVIVTKTIPISDLVAEKRVGLVVDFSAISLAHALEAILSNYGLRTALGANGRERWKEQYWSATAEAAASAYHQTLLSKNTFKNI